MIERPKFDGDIESNLRSYINYLMNNPEEAIIEAEKKHWTNVCIETGRDPYFSEYNIDYNVIYTLSMKDFFERMTEEQIEKYIEKELKRSEEWEQKQNGEKKITGIISETIKERELIKEMKLRTALLHAREAEYYKQKEASVSENKAKRR